MRGYTLIELMVTAALIGIAATTVGNAAHQQRSDGLAVLQRERAEQLLEYQAGCVAAGRPADPKTVGRLLESLPKAKVELEERGPTSQITVRWQAPGGTLKSRSLLVFRKGGR